MCGGGEGGSLRIFERTVFERTVFERTTYPDSIQMCITNHIKFRLSTYLTIRFHIYDDQWNLNNSIYCWMCITNKSYQIETKLKCTYLTITFNIHLKNCNAVTNWIFIWKNFEIYYFQLIFLIRLIVVWKLYSKNESKTIPMTKKNIIVNKSKN